jgi:2-dehydropantoate 2-reductase
VGPVDLVLFCVKSYDTEVAGKQVAPLVGEKTMIVSLQNGVDNGDRLARRWGNGRVLAAVVFLAAKIASPGVIEHSAAGEIVLGALDGAPGGKAEELQRIFDDAGVPCRLSHEIRKELWKKLVWNAPFCAISCLTGEAVKTIIESDSLRKMAVGCMEEVLEAARVRDVPLDRVVLDACLSFSRTIGDFKPSMLQDLESGKPLEHEAFNGLVLRILLEAGRKAPINQFFYGTLKFLDQRNRARRKAL